MPPPEIEIAAAYFRMWADNLRQVPVRDDEVSDAMAMTDALQKAADSLLAGNHLTWWATTVAPQPAVQPRERPPSGPHLGSLKEASASSSARLSLDG